LTTFFEAELIGKKHSFLTRKWDADEDIDRSHWSKFVGFTPEMDVAFNDPNYKYNYTNSRYVFMRWKVTNFYLFKGHF
jgi:glucose-induced degradation protein 4